MGKVPTEHPFIFNGIVYFFHHYENDMIYAQYCVKYKDWDRSFYARECKLAKPSDIWHEWRDK